MPHAAKAMDTPTHPSNPGDAGVTCPDGQKKRVKPRCAVQPPEGWEEHMFSYRDRRRSLMPHMSLPSTPSSLSQKEDHIPKEDAEMDIPKKSSDGEEEGDEGKDRDSESDGNDVEDDGPATESSLPSSSLPPPLPSDSSDTEDDLPQLCQPRWTNNKGKGRAIDVKDTNVAGSDGNTPPRSTKPGTLSHAALDDIHEFSSKVKKEAEELGRHYSRSTCDILVAAGFGVKPSHTKLNEANLFHSWYWATQPKPDGGKRPKADPLRKLVVPYLRQKLGMMYDGQSDDDEEQDSLDGVPEIEIRPWSQDVISMLESHHLKGEIPLVKAADGTVLRKVSDDPSWQKSCEEEDGRQGDPVDPPQQCQLPFPSHKRCRMEVTNDDTTRQEAAHSEHQMIPRDEGRNARSTVRDHSESSCQREGDLSRQQGEDLAPQTHQPAPWYGDLRCDVPNRMNM
ncbi:hypothetical protein EDC04DRAFT_2603416 [Pisolithus marmoratus]|nr:hypothetical protein EDC04DRAFT_2603416 [Pisolithus marmoratus]